MTSPGFKPFLDTLVYVDDFWFPDKKIWVTFRASKLWYKTCCETDILAAVFSHFFHYLLLNLNWTPKISSNLFFPQTPLILIRQRIRNSNHPGYIVIPYWLNNSSNWQTCSQTSQQDFLISSLFWGFFPNHFHKRQILPQGRSQNSFLAIDSARI